jgi:hypothetical protein
MKIAYDDYTQYMSECWARRAEICLPPTVCVTCVWAGVDNVWEQENSKPEKCLKMPQNPTRQVHALLGALGVRLIVIAKVEFDHCKYCPEENRKSKDTFRQG